MTSSLKLSFFLLFYHICTVNGNAMLKQKMSVVKSESKTVYIHCHFSTDCWSYIHWYQQKEGETLKRILYASMSDGAVNDNVDTVSFKIDKTDANKDKPVTPNVAIYSSIKNDKPVEKNTILCQASGMFPDLVKFSWETKSSSGKWTVLDMKGENVEQRDEIKNEVFVTNLLIVDKDTAKNNNYRCIVEHEGNKEPTKHPSGPLKPEKAESSVKKPDDDTPDPTCPPSEIIKQDSGKPLDQTPSMYLFVYVYGMMIMKCGVYFAAVCLFLFKSKAGKKEDKSLKPNTGIK